MELITDFIPSLRLLWALFTNTWWLWLPVVLFFVAKHMYATYLRIRYFATLQWALLEVRLPRDIAKSPQAMEQVFAGLQTMFFDFDPLETWWQGLQHDYLVFEMASAGGETRFYVRTPVFFRPVVESLIYGQYPECEIAEVADYTDKLPERIDGKEWDLFGLEFKLEKEDAYPIRTYLEFSTLETVKETERKVDPFASLAELLGKIGPGEHIGYHLLMRPVQDDTWKKTGEALVNKLIGKKTAPAKGKLAAVLEDFTPLVKDIEQDVGTVFGLPTVESAPAAKKETDGSGTSLMQHLSPGTRDIVAAIERNILKPGFEVIVRFCYVAPKDRYSLSHLSAFVGSLKQYNTQTLNGFQINGASMSGKVPWWWPPRMKMKKSLYKRNLFLAYYRARKPFTDIITLKSAFITLNTEELATIYHYPGLVAKAPLLPRIPMQRYEPPPNLPT